MIKIPEIEDDEYIQISFIKRYSKKEGGERKQRYSFYKKTLSKDVSNEMKKWLITCFDKIKDTETIDYNPSILQELPETIDLKKFGDWNQFEEKGFSGLDVSDIDLKKIKSNLVAFMIFLKRANSKYGYIRKLTKSAILDESGAYTLLFDKTSFNQLKKEKGIRIDKGQDIIFSSEGENVSGVILNKENFKSIFYLHEEDKKKSLENAKKVKIFTESKYSVDFFNSVEEDGTIQRMLRNPAFEKFLNEMEYSDLKELKNSVPELNFELNDDEKDFILPEGKEKDAIKDLIKAISGRFSKTLNRKHITENEGIKRVLT